MGRKITLGTQARQAEVEAVEAAPPEPEVQLEDGKVDRQWCRVLVGKLPSPKKHHPLVVESLPRVVSFVLSTTMTILFR